MKKNIFNDWWHLFSKSMNQKFVCYRNSELNRISESLLIKLTNKMLFISASKRRLKVNNHHRFKATCRAEAQNDGPTHIFIEINAAIMTGR